jgi:hypothetical protein
MAPSSTGSPGSRRNLITGAGLAAGAAIFGPATPALASAAAGDKPGLVVLEPSNDLTGATDSQAIKNALTLLDGGPRGVEVHLAPGDFYINIPIVLGSNKRLIGAGANATKIHQTGDGHGIIGKTDGSISYVTISGLTLIGKMATGSCGIYLAPDTSATQESDFRGISNITIEDCVVQNWGDSGVVLIAAMASRVTRVEATENGGDGFYVTFARWPGDPTGKVVRASTSLSFEACYARANAKNGYELDTVSYSTLTACAADCAVTGTRGYALFNCNAVTLTSCGA